MSLASRFLDAAAVEQLNRLQLAGRRVVDGVTTGLHRSQRRGGSVEFRQHRVYVPGDEPRRLDWRLLARTDRPFVKEYDEESNLRAVLMLDASGSMGYSDKFEYSCRLIAALAYLLLHARENVALSLRSDQADVWVPARTGPGQLGSILNAVDRVRPLGRSDLTLSVKQVLHRLRRRALVIMVSDFLSPIASVTGSMALLGHHGHEVICLRIVHPDERDFPFQRWSQFNGLENEGIALCEPAAMRDLYRKRFARHGRELQLAQRSHGAEGFTFVTQQDLMPTLTAFLRQRGGQ